MPASRRGLAEQAVALLPPAARLWTPAVWRRARSTACAATCESSCTARPPWPERWVPAGGCSLSRAGHAAVPGMKGAQPRTASAPLRVPLAPGHSSCRTPAPLRSTPAAPHWTLPHAGLPRLQRAAEPLPRGGAPLLLPAHAPPLLCAALPGERMHSTGGRSPVPILCLVLHATPLAGPHALPAPAAALP